MQRARLGVVLGRCRAPVGLCARKSQQGPRHRVVRAHASPSRVPDSDAAFLLKLLGVSLAGGVLLKYGSLLVDVPFQPNAPLATTVVLGTITVYAIALLAQRH